MKTLILVDIQYDFLPGGALAVPQGDAVVPVANVLARAADLVIATQDFHPPDHKSFAANHDGRDIGEVVDLDGLSQILWPVHCVQGTRGAELVDELERERIAKVFPKGTDSSIDSYSGFFDNGHRKATGLGDYLKQQGAGQLWVCGLATDYCVKFTVLDALELGFETTLVVDGCRGVNLSAGDVDAAVAAMRDISMP